MKAENFNVTVPEGQNKVEVIVRELNEEVKDRLPVIEPIKIGLSGNITALYAFLEKRWNASDPQIDHCRTHILVDRDNLTLTLICNETDERNRMQVTGKIALSRQYLAFGINSGKLWESIDLGNFFRINRTYFENKEANMTLVNLLKRFEAKVHTEIERENKDNGSVTDNYRKVVESNLPDKFSIKIPIYKGAAAEVIEVEVIAHVEGRHALLELISPSAQSIVEEVRDKLIDEQLDQISELAPEIPIIEV
ncbi:MAG: hypothetical protein IJ588_06270 [Prevotella sp.]|nr:hypothetical protein [Prevotella sp.]